ncbi:MAG: transcriptional repressor [Deltaproteobacteria bacterium]|nr:transcriptional repressor [Deltaproteobacteria bacterium]
MKSMDEQLLDFETSCRNSGLKVTHQRMEIFRELLTADDHPTADILHQRIRNKLPTVSLDTVYRTLATLADCGLINRVNTSESLARFEVRKAPHHHLICRRCGVIKDFIWPFIDKAELPDGIANWGEIKDKNLVAYGICRKCLNKN